MVVYRGLIDSTRRPDSRLGGDGSEGTYQLGSRTNKGGAVVDRGRGKSEQSRPRRCVDVADRGAGSAANSSSGGSSDPPCTSSCSVMLPGFDSGCSSLFLVPPLPFPPSHIGGGSAGLGEKFPQL